MARKFLYFVAAMTVLVIAALVALRLFAPGLSELAFVPRGKFEPQDRLAASRYEDAAMWIARPGMAGINPAAWTPTGLVEDADALGAAVFFIHPTSYLVREHWNAPLDDKEANDRARLFVRGMASAFNKAPDIWAPRYRQATFGAFLSDAPAARRALDLAYGDVETAFDRFLAATPPERPIVLAGHSQGALMVMRLLAARVAGKPLARRVAAAYVIGWPVSLRHDLPAMGLPACAAPGQAGCVMSWQSFAEPAEPPERKDGIPAARALDGGDRFDAPPLCTNPLTGRVGGAAPASANLGTLVPDANPSGGRLQAGLVPARCADSGLLLIGPPPELGPYVLPGNNYHVYDVPLFWANLRADVSRRVKAWKP